MIKLFYKGKNRGIRELRDMGLVNVSNAAIYSRLGIGWDLYKALLLPFSTGSETTLSFSKGLLVRKMYKSGNYTFELLGRMFDVSTSTIDSIINRDFE